MDTLLTQRDAALALSLSERTLERMRVQGFGPPFVRCGRSVRYRSSDLDQWIASRVVRSTSEELGRAVR
jgi:predicted DNA-binding transcriptional regulator AlpA